MSRPVQTLNACIEALDARRKTSRGLVESCLTAILEPDGEGARTFTKFYDRSARSDADTFDLHRRNGYCGGLLGGLPISIKDLFDVAGEPTPAGSVIFAESPIAADDATVVTRLREAGAVIVGRTNMTEFAFSGLGLNPHCGTARNPWARSEGRIPGGSSSGAAVSVADGMALAAIASDTGGSVRIPAALCGLTGFKPTARRVPLTGVFPLAPSLDSIGSIAPTVACCARLDSVLAGEPYQAPVERDPSSLRLGLLQGYVLDGLDTAVSRSFEFALDVLSKAGMQILDTSFPGIEGIPASNSKGGLAAVESYAWHRGFIERESGRYDPRVLKRILRGKEISSSEYDELRTARRLLIQSTPAQFSQLDAWVLPTVPWIAPRIAELEQDEEKYYAANAAMLRNPSLVNYLDGCALSLPCQRIGEAPVGFMLVAPSGNDSKLLGIAAAVERCFAAEELAVHRLG